MKRILIAGIGNIFHGDDAFGCEVVRALNTLSLPEEVTVRDFGIRSYDLAFALTDGFDAVILVDAMPRQVEPGTVCLIEPNLERLGELQPAAVDAHSMNPVSVLQMAQSFGEIRGELFLVGCEPAVLENETGEIKLSERVAAAAPLAVEMILDLLKEILGQQENNIGVAELKGVL